MAGKRKTVKRRGGVGWERVIMHGEPAIRCTVCEAIVPVAKWWQHHHGAPVNQAEGVKP